MAIIFSSENIMLRAMTLWRGNLWATLVLVAMALGHWAAGITVFLVPVVDAWLKYSDTCEIVSGAGGPVPFYVYTMVFDLTILGFTLCGLLRIREASSSPLWSHLLKQGFGYFVITFVVNVLTLAFAVMQLNVYVGDIFSAPGATISVICSCRAVVSLLHMNEDIGSAAIHHTNTDEVKTRSRALSTNIMLTMSLTSNEIQSVVLRSPARATFRARSSPADEASCSGTSASVVRGIDVRIIPVSHQRAVSDSLV
ncbi:hypothetical protein PsYK624_052110 [Phanerochaete sordida]|uniref:Transmembrane protein n=1 Tax=Phanerochaete sordida TaxID=48140 RepID=A0A9P3G6U1_9APHY|nr:hypothetical protein PsYK624_052110 [Phanerochaete sordida]